MQLIVYEECDIPAFLEFQVDWINGIIQDYVLLGQKCIILSEENLIQCRVCH